MSSEDVRAVPANGNIFAVLGYEDPEAELARAHLASQLRDIIKSRKLTQSEAGAILGIPQPKVSNLMRGQIRGFSIERLMTFLNRMGREVQINVYPAGGGRSAGHTSVQIHEESLAAAPIKREGVQFS
jgi:predicted XRE-type DNA-binding protein